MIDEEVRRLLLKLERNEYIFCPYQYKPDGFRAERNQLLLKLFISTGVPFSCLVRLKKEDVIFKPPLNVAIKVKYGNVYGYNHELMLPGLDDETSKLEWREQIGYRLSHNYWATRKRDWLFPADNAASKFLHQKTAAQFVIWLGEYSPFLKRNIVAGDIAAWNISMVMRRLEHSGVNRMDIVNVLRPSYVSWKDRKYWYNHYTREELLLGAVMPKDDILPVPKYWYIYKRLWEVENKRHNRAYRKTLLGWNPRHIDIVNGDFVTKIDLTRNILDPTNPPSPSRHKGK